MRKTIFAIIILFSFNWATAQIYFSGKSEITLSKDQVVKIQVFRPVANTVQPFYADTLDDILMNKEGHFYKVIKSKDSGLYFLGMPNGQQFRVVALPGDTIHFKLIADSNGRYELQFSGSNGFANSYVNEVRQKVQTAINEIDHKGYEVTTFWEKIDSFITTSDHQIKEVEKDDYLTSFLTKSVRIEVLYAIISRYGQTSDNNPDLSRRVAICEEAYKRFNPLQRDNLSVSPVALININKLGYHIRENRIKFAASKFSNIDSNWANINEGFTMPSTLPEPFREAQIGIYILLDAIKLNGESTTLAMKYFAYQYPKSAFTDIFLKILLHPESTGRTEGTRKESVSANSGVVIIKNDTDLDKALKKYASNKRVLIDCWATWCIYCIAEFPYYSRFDRFFSENDIVLFFISYDNPLNRYNIEKIIANNKLNGIHLVVNPEIKKQVSKLANLSNTVILPLPRYILLDKQHRVVDADMIRPSNPNFINQIKEKINSSGK